MDQENELMHYGVLGMKWGVRRATYKAKSADQLKKSAKKIERDNYILTRKKLRQDRRTYKNFRKGNIKRAAKHMKKSYRRGKTIKHNTKLLRLYEKRIDELDSKAVSKGKNFVQTNKKVKFNKPKEKTDRNILAIMDGRYDDIKVD